MNRKIYKNLRNWKVSNNRMPLILMGARQVGKTYILKEFGHNEFKNIHYVNFEKDKEKYKDLFLDGLDPLIIISNLEIINDIKIDIKKDILIFDEIQEFPNAITSLKYFCEDLKELAIVSAGSHIGISLSTNSFPVGKVDILNMYPMTFEEFLMEKNQKLAECVRGFDFKKGLPKIIHDKLWKELKNYYIVGGLPAVVKSYIKLKNSPQKAFDIAREIQQNLIIGYQSDFSKHSGKENANHIGLVFNNIAMQLQKEHDASIKRFRFKDVIPKKSKYSELSGAIEWLLKTGLILKVNITEKPHIPLKYSCKENFFKLLIFDVGILACMLELPYQSILNQDYGRFKGYFAENFVAQELISSGIKNLYSWTERNSEMEFLHCIENKIIPIEVKSGNRTKAKSLAEFTKKYNPETKIKLSAKPYIEYNDFYNMPLYLANKINSID